MLAKRFELKHSLKKTVLLCTFLGFTFANTINGQEFKKGETIFGIEVKGIFPTSILDSGPVDLGDDSLSIHMKSPSGYSFGMIIRHNFTKMFTIETGIHLTNRIYSLNITNSNNGFNENSKIELDSYEIPVQWLLFIRLGDQFYMNTIFGISLDIFPSDVSKTEKYYRYYIQRDNWIKASILASIGFEYRTKKSGFFYLGGSVHSPFGNIGRLYVSYFHNDIITEDVTYNSEIKGTYFSLEFRYFFNKKEKVVKPVTY